MSIRQSYKNAKKYNSIIAECNLERGDFDPIFDYIVGFYAHNSVLKKKFEQGIDVVEFLEFINKRIDNEEVILIKALLANIYEPLMRGSYIGIIGFQDLFERFNEVYKIEIEE